MDDVKVGKVEEISLDADVRGEEQQDNHPDDVADKKTIILATVVVVALFALFFTGFYFYDYYSPTGKAVSVDELHQQNLNQELSEDEGYLYHGYSFVQADGLWWTELNKFGTQLKIPLHFGPRELEAVEVSGNLDQQKFNSVEGVYIAIDPSVVNKYYTLAISELSFNLVKGMDRTPIGSCTTAGPGCDNRTIVSCSNTHGRPVIELALTEQNESKIELSDQCIKISGNGYGIVKAVDRLLYQWYGVMQSAQ